MLANYLQGCISKFMSKFDKEPDTAEVRELFPASKDCLEQMIIWASRQSITTPEHLQYFRDRLLDRRGDMGQMICERTGCLANCVVRVTDERVELSGSKLIDIDAACNRLQDIADGNFGDY